MSTTSPIFLTCQLDLPDRIVVGESLFLTFRLHNQGETSVRVLTWQTPLEGFFSHFLQVTRDGVELPYQGPLLKRGATSREDYRVIKAGKSVKERVEPTQVYAFDQPGRYELLYIKSLLDVALPGVRLPRPSGTWQPYPLSCAPRVLQVVGK